MSRFATQEQPSSEEEQRAPRVIDIPTIDIGPKEFEFLKTINKTLDYGKRVRLLFDPAPTRNNPNVIPKKVQLVAEEECFSQYIVFELNKERARHMTPAQEARQAIR